MIRDRWELGSEFHLDLPPYAASSGHDPTPWDSGPNRLYGCGRDALAEVLTQGRDSLGWRRIWIPDYLCQEVVSVAVSILEPHVYRSLPIEPFSAPWEHAHLDENDAVLVVNRFGLLDQIPLPADRTFSVIEDHTHDPFSPWAERSVADFAVASLRKTLPLPDGGVLWSPRGHRLPTAVSESVERAQATQEKLVGMAQKALFLAGGEIDKATFRQHATSGESSIAKGAPSTISATSRALLTLTPWRVWRAQRGTNFGAFRAVIRGQSEFQLLTPEPNGAIAFSCVLLSPSNAARNSLREHLVNANIFPSVLWPLEDPVPADVSADAVALSRRLLSIHCDHRYTPNDLQLVARTVTDWVDREGGSAGH